MTLGTGAQLLGDRYILRSALGDEPDGSKLWLGTDEDQSTFLVKTWAYTGDRPSDIERALWDSSLRVLYRISSSAGAARGLVQLRDAGVDTDSRVFAMVLTAPGQSFVRVSDQLLGSYTYPSGPDERLIVWRSIRQLVDSIDLLHHQQVLHRNVGPDVTFVDPVAGISSMRLGGFEWSTRIGSGIVRRPAASWSQPPEMLNGTAPAFQVETDWFGLGVLAARLLVPLENFVRNDPDERYERTMEAIRTRTGRQLGLVERDTLIALLEPNATDRMSRVDDIRRSIEDIVRGLEAGGSAPRAGSYLLLAVAPTNERLIDALEQSGFAAEPSDTTEPYNPNNPAHKARFVEFIRSDIAGEPRLTRIAGMDRLVLTGSQLNYWVQPFRDSSSGVTSWDVAMIGGPANLRGGSASPPVDLSGHTISVRTVADAYDPTVRKSATSWVRVLPEEPGLSGLRPRASELLDVVRATNQIELLLRDAEVFPFELRRRWSEGYTHYVTVAEVPRQRPVPQYASVRDGLIGFLRTEQASQKPRWDELVLSDEDTLRFDAPEENIWVLHAINEDRTITLRRTGDKGYAPNSGFIRTVGMLIGQTRLMIRRNAALERLPDHTYLLDALAAPGQVFMDTGVPPLPISLPADRVDAPKRACIEDVVRTRPIYTLQGPPGTGKTTMVAWLIRELLAEDPVAQILVTAQAHGAVDVLRDKVAREAFAGTADEDLPIAVRLAGEDDAVRGGINDVTTELLERSKRQLMQCDSLDDLQRTWLGEIDKLLAAIDPEHEYEGDADAADFREVVRRGASITYCTTSDRGLEAIARTKQSFDWSIVEEAGKAHSFDLVMPLQAGHRWLLIGDHQQLPPYRFESYRDALVDLDGAVEAVRNLPSRGGGLVDDEWVRQWEDTSPEERSRFKNAALRWLESFRTIFEQCERAPGRADAARTTDVSIGASAGRLTMQHRMHPSIGSLVSHCYYDGEIGNGTVDESGSPMKRVLHGLTAPVEVVGRSIVWLDTPWCVTDPRAAEDGTVPFTNLREAEVLCDFMAQLRGSPSAPPLTLALLSPYTQQVHTLRSQLRRVTLPEGIVPKPHQRGTGAHDSERMPAFTVDSFQGNQADIVGISLVRNNQRAPGEGLGFLSESSRMNVLLSRAERLLVLVGSWDFFANQVATVPEADVSHPLQHWRRVVRTLDDAFSDGSAIRVAT